MPASFGVVDLFAGPGGLGEGFASLDLDGHIPFHIGISVENEHAAHCTLRVRAFQRGYRSRYNRLPEEFLDFHANKITEPEWSDIDRHVWQAAAKEACCLELGTAEAAEAIDGAVTKLHRDYDENILIGGPPCQAYSLVGRVRSRAIIDYVPEDDKRHYLFREYIRVLEKLRPAAFVMENVKGLLSSKLGRHRVYEMLMEDLKSLCTANHHLYEMRAVRVDDSRASLREPEQPSDFIVRAEDFGIPQRRHRVIIIGIRYDLANKSSHASISVDNKRRTVADAIGALPRLRSGISRCLDSSDTWKIAVIDAANHLSQIYRKDIHSRIRNVFLETAEQLMASIPPPRTSVDLPAGYGTSDDVFQRWIERGELHSISQHETRAHMKADLERYLYASVFGKVHGFSPKASDFPRDLSPNHRNWQSGVFSDRFRAQLADQASTTITSHISKDGHYYIHPDPLQCRSFTVREAARLQTFPDDYLFMGNRTQQYVQVGNAVPPYLARQIAHLISKAIQED